MGDPNRMYNGMIEGIQDMQILYGIDFNTDGVADYYVSAFANMTQVVSVRISLLAVTLDDNLTPQPIPYTYYVNNIPTNIMPADRKIRRIFTTTIALRNHLQ